MCSRDEPHPSVIRDLVSGIQNPRVKLILNNR